MPKMKTHRGAAKRFKITAGGKLKRRHAFQSHLLEKKASKRKRKLKKEAALSSTNEKSIRRLLAGG